jgi:homoserine O-acetyltransferase
MSTATQWFQLGKPFQMKRGGTLPDLTLAFETWGELNADHSNAVMIFTGLSPNAHAASSQADPDNGWWEPMIGPGKPIDSDRFFIICANSLGSCMGSTGPASDNPETGKPWRTDFPELGIEDIAASSQLLLQHLGVERLKVVVGPSMGGMTALSFLQQFPGHAEHMLSISSCAAAEPYAIAVRSLQREAICSDRLWKDGKYSDDEWPRTGMRMARKLGMMTYRSAFEWKNRFGREAQDRYPHQTWGMYFQIESYLEAAADRFIGSFDPASYIYLSRAMDWFDLTNGSGDIDKALQNSGLKTACVIGVETDILFPVRQQAAIADALSRLGSKIDFYSLPSHEGHDAFLVDYDRFLPIVADYFNKLD